MSAARSVEIKCDHEKCRAVVRMSIESNWDARRNAAEEAGWVTGIPSPDQPKVRLDFCPEHAGQGALHV